VEKSNLAAERPNGGDAVKSALVSKSLDEAFNNLRQTLLESMAAQGGIDIPGMSVLMRVQFVHLHALQAHLVKKGLISKEEIDKELAEAFNTLAAATKKQTQAPKIMVPSH